MYFGAIEGRLESADNEQHTGLTAHMTMPASLQTVLSGGSWGI
jgi:hypothetical protein